MNQNDIDAIKHYSALLDSLLEGKTRKPLQQFDSVENKVLAALLERCDQIAVLVNDWQSSIADICDGNYLDKQPVNSYLFGIGELSEQLSELSWAMQQLAEGNMVSKLYGEGVLCDSFNHLVDRITEQIEKNDVSHLNTIIYKNHMRYRQILSALNNLRIMVIETDRSGGIRFANRSAEECLGKIQNLEDKSGNNSILIHHLVRANNANRSFPVVSEVYDETVDHWYKITSDLIQAEDGKISFLHMIDDISEWKHREIRLKHKASIDALTNIFNRSVGLEALEQALSYPSIHTCAAFVDVDDLKVINDTFGHASGDQAIQTISEILSTSVREQDMVCRYGGDEFLVILLGCSERDAESLFQRVKKRLDQQSEQRQLPYRLSISYGILDLAAEKTNSVPDIIQKMDRIMYRYKKQKKL